MIERDNIAPEDMKHHFKSDLLHEAHDCRSFKYGSDKVLKYGLNRSGDRRNYKYFIKDKKRKREAVGVEYPEVHPTSGNPKKAILMWSDDIRGRLSEKMEVWDEDQEYYLPYEPWCKEDLPIAFGLENHYYLITGFSNFEAEVLWYKHEKAPLHTPEVRHKESKLPLYGADADYEDRLMKSSALFLMDHNAHRGWKSSDPSELPGVLAMSSKHRDLHWLGTHPIEMEGSPKDSELVRRFLYTLHLSREERVSFGEDKSLGQNGYISTFGKIPSNEIKKDEYFLSDELEVE